MTKFKNKGYTVEINMSWLGYPGYSVECTYYFDKKRDNIRYLCGLLVEI